MSWLFSRALVEEYSADTCSDGALSAPLSVMPTAHSFWRRGKTIEPSGLSLFGLTCEVLTDDRGEALLASYRQDFLARTLAPQARAAASTESAAAYGKRPGESFATWNPTARGWRTAQCSLLGDSDEFSATWPKWGSMRNGVCFQRARPDSTTCASASGFSLPTPSGVNGGTNNTMGRIDEWGGSSNPLRGTVIGSMCLPEFEEMVMGWPIGWTALTPYATDKFRAWLSEHGENYPALSEAA